MTATTLTLTIETPALSEMSSWSAFESLGVQMGKELPATALAEALHDAQAALLENCCGPAWKPVRDLPAPFACPRCAVTKDFARYGARPRPRKLHTAVGTVELTLANVRCRACQKVFAPLLLVLGLWGKRRTDRLTLDLADLASQMSFARAARVDKKLAGTTVTAGQAHNALADVAGMLTGGPEGVIGTGHEAPDVVLFDGTGVRAGSKKNGTCANLAIGLTGRSGPAGRRRAHSHLLGLTVGEDWSMLGAQLAHLPAPALVVVDGETAITALAQSLWSDVPIQRCWWHRVALCGQHGLRKACYVDDANNRHVSAPWARQMAKAFGELLREQIRHEHDIEAALADYDAFTKLVPAKLTSTHAYLAAARPHTFTCLDPGLRAKLARLGGPELGTGVLERLMREINARTDIGGSRWSVAGLRDLLTVLTARLLGHPSWKGVTRSIYAPSTMAYRLEKPNVR